MSQVTYPEGFPRVVCLIGSTRFKQQFIEANLRESLAGKIVLSVGWFSHVDGEQYTLTAAEKDLVDKVYLHKVDMAHEVFVINPGGYIGESTARELARAQRAGKPVRFLEPPVG